MIPFFSLAQTAAEDVFKGFDSIRLGDPESKFGKDLVMIKGVDTTKPEYAPYAFGYNNLRPISTHPEIIDFNYFMLYFDRDHRLSSIEYIQFYQDGKALQVRPYKKYKPQLEALVAYFTGKTGQEGKKVVYYEKGNSVDEGYEWENGEAKLSVKTSKSKNTHGKRASISIWLERKKA